MTDNLPEKVRDYDDNRWFAMLLKSIKTPVVKGIEFPLFPSKELQTTFVGSANDKALKEAFFFYKFVKDEAAKAMAPLQPSSRFLDFGCGWGRYLRFFWKDVDIGNLYGCDVNPMIVDTCQSLKVPGNISTIEPTGSLPYDDNFFNTVIAYSVFTHLPEKIHMHWMREIARVTKPGSIFCLTLEPRRFIEFIETIPESPGNDWYRKLSAHKPNLDHYYRDFDAGKLVFMPTNEGMEGTYGDAAVPLSFIQDNWQPYFEVLDYIDDPGKFWQAVLVVRRTNQPI